MSVTPADLPPGRPAPWRRLHAALMPDYNRASTVYWWTMLVLGGSAWLWSVWQLRGLPPPTLALIGGFVGLAMLMGLFPLRIPRTNQSFSIGDVFIFLLLLMHGPAAGCVAAGLESLVSAWRSSRRWTTRLGSASIATVSMAACGPLLEHGVLRPLAGAADHSALLVLAAMAFGLLHSACTMPLLTAVARLKRNERLHLADFVSVFGWVGGANAGAAALAALLYLTERLVGLGVMLTIVPIIALLLTTLHFFARQQQADHAIRKAREQALQHEAELTASRAREREAELAAQHLLALESSERRFHSAFTHASIGMALVAMDGTIHLANPALHALLGFEVDALEGKLVGQFVDQADVVRMQSSLRQAAEGHTDVIPLEVRCRRPDGREVWASIACSMFAEPEAAGPSLILQVQDVTARRSAEVELHHRAYHDKLTGLPNRERFHDALGLAIERADGGPGRAFAVLFLDFDRFKLINDSKGHSVGDQFLIQASRRLASCLRQDDMLARLGGDEFAILAGNLHRDSDAVDLAERLLDALREPLHLGTMDITATASIGITFSSLGYTRPEDMLRDADIAMYRAKTDGKARHALFDAHLHTEVAKRVRLEADLRVALDEQALSVAYQPLYHLGSGRLEGFEALVRWHHPELGPVSPASFIPIAEESGLICQLTAYVAETACRQLAQWQRQDPGRQGLCVHVNVAARDVADPEFVGRVRQILRHTGLQSRHLVVELTENILMAQLSAAMGTLTALRELGVGLSVDDFGTGYSSLSHLSVLPIDSLKIDMSFVRHLRPGSKEAAVIRAIVLLGTSLGKEVIAEGIENAVQMELLRDLGCHIGQGYHLSRPIPAADVERLLEGLRHGRPAPAPAPAAGSTAPAALAN